MKKYVFPALLIFIAVYFVRCLYPGSYRPDSKVSIETSSTNLNEVASMLSDKYLSQYKKFNVIKRDRLKDYTINSVDIIQDTKTPDSFEFILAYSVKPDSLDSYWVAGNGEQGLIWIRNKAAFVQVEKSGDKYVITSMGTGP